MAYQPEPIGSNPTIAQLVDYLVRELARVGGALQAIEDGDVLPMLTAAPAKPREGRLAIADGTSWNPGSGKGLYEYRASAWVKL